MHSQLSGRHTLIIPCGGDELNGWVVLRDCIRRVGAVVEREAPEQQQLQQQQQQQQSQPVADAQHAGEGGSEPRPPPPPPQPQQPPVLDVASSLVVGPGHPPPTLTTSPQGTPVLSCNGRRVFFDIGSTSRGHYMRITEVAHQDRRAWRCQGAGSHGVEAMHSTRTRVSSSARSQQCPCALLSCPPARL
jgi:hypothetical protein